MRFVLICAALLAAAPAFAQSVRDFGRDFEKSMNEDCLRRQRAAPVNAGLPDAMLVKYCGCIARHAPDIFSMEDLMEIARTGQRGRDLQNKLNAAGEACMAWVNGEISDEMVETKPRR
jgi:hypothetical protein